MTTTFGSLDAFYAADERRRYSGEMDFGVWWFDERRAAHRVSAIKDTGEIYALSLGGLMGREGAVTLLASGLPIGSYDDAERLLDGWPEQCGLPRSLGWVKSRLGCEVSA